MTKNWNNILNIVHAEDLSRTRKGIAERGRAEKREGRKCKTVMRVNVKPGWSAPAVVRHDSVSRNYAARPDMSDYVSLFLLKPGAPRGREPNPMRRGIRGTKPEIFGETCGSAARQETLSATTTDARTQIAIVWTSELARTNVSVVIPGCGKMRRFTSLDEGRARYASDTSLRNNPHGFGFGDKQTLLNFKCNFRRDCIFPRNFVSFGTPTA